MKWQLLLLLAFYSLLARSQNPELRLYENELNLFEWREDTSFQHLDSLLNLHERSNLSLFNCHFTEQEMFRGETHFNFSADFSRFDALGINGQSISFKSMAGNYSSIRITGYKLVQFTSQS